MSRHSAGARTTTAHARQALSGRIGSLLDRRHPPAGLVLFSTALFVGIVTGLAAVLFRYLINAVAWVGYTWLPALIPGGGTLYIILIPALGGLLGGLLIHYAAPEIRGSGIPEVMAAVALKGGRIRARVAPLKAAATALTIGSGGSAGREGPIVQIGSAVGSAVGQALRLSEGRISNLVACGAAAGIAATFNAPIAGVIFALEVILGRFSVRYFSSVVIASVAASVIGRAAFGDLPAFDIPVTYGLNSLWEFLFYPVLGLLAALVGVAFTRLLYLSSDLFAAPKRLPPWLRPALGGALLGVLALAYPIVGLTQPVTWERMPHIYGVGYDIIEGALASEVLFVAAVVLLGAKMIATCLTLGSGAAGGVFAPMLFMGAMLGTAFQLGVNFLFPGISAPPGAYALVGMAAVFAAGAHAPITAVLTLFEMTGDYRIILPLMLTVVVATVLAQLLLRGESIYTLRLLRQGIRLERGRDVDILQGVTVGEVMTLNFDSVRIMTSISELAGIFADSHHHGLLVEDDEGRLAGIVTLSDLERALEKKLPGETPVQDIATIWPHLLIAFPDESMGDALARMSARGLGRLPVVAREDPYHLLGILRRESISRAYNMALARRSEIEERARTFQDRHEGEAEFVEIPLVAGDKAVGRSVQQITATMPQECILVSIRRDGRIVIPHGDTTFQAGDLITAFVRTDDARKLFHCLHGKPEQPA